MSETPRSRGPQGVQGVQGIEGIEGQGIRGVQGEPGAPGERGPRGRMLARNVTLSFAAVVLIAFLVLLVVAWQARATRQLTGENRRVIESLCNTTATLDAALVVPFLIETKLAIKAAPVGEARARLVRLQENLEIAHEELSATQNCEEVR